MAADLTVIQCWSCTVSFAVPNSFIAARRFDHATFYCPAGHGCCYSQETESEALKRQLAAVTKERDDAGRTAAGMKNLWTAERARAERNWDLYVEAQARVVGGNNEAPKEAGPSAPDSGRAP